MWGQIGSVYGKSCFVRTRGKLTSTRGPPRKVGALGPHDGAVGPAGAGGGSGTANWTWTVPKVPGGAHSWSTGSDSRTSHRPWLMASP
jgi:hypothetical protein